MRDRERISRIFKGDQIAERIRNLSIFREQDPPGAITEDNPTGGLLHLKLRIEMPADPVGDYTEEELATARAESILMQLGIDERFKGEVWSWHGSCKGVNFGTLHLKFQQGVEDDGPLTWGSTKEHRKVITNVNLRNWEGAKGDTCTDITISMPESISNNYLITAVDMDELEILRIEALEDIKSLKHLGMELLLPDYKVRELRELEFINLFLSQSNLGERETKLIFKFAGRNRNQVSKIKNGILDILFTNPKKYTRDGITRVGTTTIRDDWDRVWDYLYIEVVVNEQMDSPSFPHLNREVMEKLKGQDLRVTFL